MSSSDESRRSGDAPHSAMRAASPTIATAAGLGVLTSLFGVAASVARSKATALFLGPIGIGISAEIQQLATLALVPIAVFSGPALHQALAREQRNQSEPRAVSAAASWSVVFGLIFAALATLSSPLLLPKTWGSEQHLLVFLSCVGLIAAGFNNVVTSMFVFEARLAITTRLQIITAALSAVSVVVLTAVFGLVGQFIAFAATPLLVLPWILRSVGASERWPRPFHAFFDREFLLSAFKVGTASLVAAAALQGALFAIRWILERAGGPELNGQFQASWSIGSIYLSMILGGIGTFAFPRYAAAQTPEALQIEVDRTAHFVARFAPPIIVLAIAYSDIGVRLLYSDRFDTAMEILKWQFAGDFAKCLAWVYAGPLLFRMRIRAFLVTELIAAVVLATSAYLLVSLDGPRGVGQAYLITQAIYLPIVAVALRVSLKTTARLQDLTVAVATTLGLALMVGLFDYSLAHRALATVAAVLWLWRTGGIAGAVSIVRRRIARGRTGTEVS